MSYAFTCTSAVHCFCISLVMDCTLTDSGRRSTFTWSPSSKPSGTLFCISSGMVSLRLFSDWPFCHCSSCLRESTSIRWRDITCELMAPWDFPAGIHTDVFHMYKPSMSSLTAWDSTESLFWVVSTVFPPLPSLWSGLSGLCQRFFWINGMMSSFGLSDGFELQDKNKLPRRRFESQFSYLTPDVKHVLSWYNKCITS